jgi:hypothetical protein
MALAVTKSSGRIEDFDIRKLINSLVRSGAPDDVASEIAGKVLNRVTAPVHTKHIYRIARRLLRQYSRVSGMRYSIKRAIVALGPTGYPFEKYIGRVLSAYGYTVEVNRMTKGFCVTHEVDVFAAKDNRICIIECKHHAVGDKPEDVKIALYVHSRINDIKKALEMLPEYSSLIHEGWLVTNTRCSSDAVKYAECVGLKILSWKYPEHESLEIMIERKGLYPVTIMRAATKSAMTTLTQNNIIMMEDIAGMDENTFVKKSGLDRNSAFLIKREADEIWPRLSNATHHNSQL